LQRKNKGGIFIVSAPSGAGKTTLCNKILDSTDNIRPSVSFTTRMPRKGEVHDRDYTFIGEREFRTMIKRGEFAEWAVVHGNLYGTSARRLREIMNSGCDVLLDVDVQGARQIRESFPSGVFVFVLPPSLEILRERLEKRKSNTAEDIERRMRRAVDEIRDYTRYEYVIVNHKLRDSVKLLGAIIAAERLRTRRTDPDWVKKKFFASGGKKWT
jgi:guanylate kinase